MSKKDRGKEAPVEPTQEDSLPEGISVSDLDDDTLEAKEEEVYRDHEFKRGDIFRTKSMDAYFGLLDFNEAKDAALVVVVPKHEQITQNELGTLVKHGQTIHLSVLRLQVNVQRVLIYVTNIGDKWK